MEDLYRIRDTNENRIRNLKKCMNMKAFFASPHKDEKLKPDFSVNSSVVVGGA